MKKETGWILIWTILLILNIFLVKAIDPALIYYDTGDITLNGTTMQSSFNRSVLAYNWTDVSGGNFSYTTARAYNGSFSIAGHGYNLRKTIITPTTNWTVEVMIYDDGALSFGRLNTMITGDELNWGWRDGGNYGYQVDSSPYADSGIARSVGWHNFKIWTKTESDHIMCIDGTCFEDSSSVLSGVNKIKLNTNDPPMDGEIYYDNFLVYHGNITPAIPAASASGTSFLTFQNTLPLNNTQFNIFNISINTTVNSSSNYNCTLFVNSSSIFNWTNNDLSIFSINYTYNFSSTSAKYNYFFNCSNLNGTNAFTNSNSFFYVDTNIPITTTTFSNRIYYYNNITAIFNFSDDFLLFSYNLSIDGNLIYSQDNLNVLNISVNFTYNPKQLSAGTHYLTARVADGHTATLISNYGVDQSIFNNDLTYNFDNGKSISIAQTSKDKSIFDTFTTEKQTDRYIFDFTPSVQADSYTFDITSTDKINVINNNGDYKNYLIMDNHWMDFVVSDQPDSKVSIIPIDDNNVQVTVSGLDPTLKTITFSSIGDLNIMSTNYTFTTINSTATWINEVSETQSHQTNLYFNITGSGLSDSNFSAMLNYNGTIATLLKTSDGSNYVNFQSTLTAPIIGNSSDGVWFNWSVNISSNPTEFVFYNQTVYKINIGDCSKVNTSDGWASSLNFLSLDEEQNETTFVNTTLNIDFNVWVTDENTYRNFSFGFSNNYNYSICIFPNSSSYRINAIMEYFAPNYANRKYYLDNYILDNVTDLVYLYNLNSSKSSDITINVIDKNTGQSVSGAFVKILRYYPQNGTYKVVEIEKTDENGFTLGKMVLADVFYKFIVETDRTVRLSTEVQRILSLSKTLPIIQGSNILESWKKIGGVSSSVTCTNSTLICRFTWSDSSNLVQTATLKVFRINGYGRTLINEQSLSAVAGTLSYHIAESTGGNEYIAYGYFHTNTANSFYQVGEAYLKFRDSIAQRFGTSALLPFLLLLLSVGAVFIQSGGTAVIAASLLGLTFGILIGFIDIGLVTIVSIIIIGILLIAKLRE